MSALTLPSPAAAVSLGATVAAFAGCIVGGGAATATVLINDYTLIDLAAIPAGWQGASLSYPAVSYYNSMPKSAAELQTDLRGMALLGKALGDGTLTVTVDDGTPANGLMTFNVDEPTDAVDFDSTAEWDANTRVVFFDWETEQVVSPSGAAVADSDAARTAAGRAPTGDPGHVSIPNSAAPGRRYFAKAFQGPALTLDSEAFFAWGIEEGLPWDGTNLGAASGQFTDAIWTYSNGTSFLAFNGIANTDLEADLERDGNGDMLALQNAGKRGDRYINELLAGMGFTIPLANLDATGKSDLEYYSNLAARWQLFKVQQFGLFVGRTITPDDATASANADKAEVDAWVDRLESGAAMLSATRSEQTLATGSAIESVPLNFGDTTGNCDEFGCSF